jgi:hypothetical protein
MAGPEDIMASFDVKSFFACVLKETMNQLDQQISVDITGLIHLMLLFDGQFHEQMKQPQGHVCHLS